MEIVVATRNPHKLEEIRSILGDLPVTLLSAVEVGAPEVVEDESTLEGNARKKARAVAAATGRLALADDTGLRVDALGGRPGVESARYAGPGATYAANVAKLLRELRGVAPAARTARFECVIAIARPSGVSGAADAGLIKGALEGAIALEPRGKSGFGYDPVFLVAGDPEGRTLAELGAAEKNRLSHRARALAGLRARLEDIAV